MENNMISLLKDRPIIIPRIFLNNYKLLNISDSEFK